MLLNKTIIAKTSQGLITGVTVNLDKEKDAHFFHKVPYAHTPVGRRRFAPPEAINNWYDEEVLFRGQAFKGFKFLEDFLRMDIFTPEVKNHDDEQFDRPVIVFVPGDVQSNVSTNYGPRFFLRENVVLVIVSYRVGILGFVKFEDPDANAPGDVGLMDLKAAFTWIRKEIENFGGCSKNITAYGHGLGAKHIRLLLTSSMFENCFDKAILSSCIEHEIANSNLYENGNYIGPYLTKDILQYQEDTDSYTECPEGDLACVDILRKFDINKLQYYGNLMIVEHTAEKLSPTKLRNLREQLYETKIPIIIGYNSHECLFDRFDGDELDCTALVGARKEMLLNFILEHGGADLTNEFEMDDLAQSFLDRQTIYNPSELSHLTAFQRKVVSLSISTLYKYLFGIKVLAGKIAREMSPENVFLYRFNVYEPSFHIRGSPHGKELKYLFEFNWVALHQVDDGRTAEERELSKVMVKLWAQFARTGNPNPTEPYDLIKSVWQPIRGNISHPYNISNTGVSHIKISEMEQVLTIPNDLCTRFFS